MRMLDPVASRLPYMVAAGNHEIETNGGYAGTKPFLAYEHRFRMPAVEKPTRLGHGCGVGGGLGGDGEVCGEGFGAGEADAAAVEAARRSELAAAARGGALAGKAVGAAVRRAARGVREAFDVAEAGAGAEDAEPSQCCPSEWSGTYDFGNRWFFLLLWTCLPRPHTHRAASYPGCGALGVPCSSFPVCLSAPPNCLWAWSRHKTCCCVAI